LVIAGRALISRAAEEGVEEGVEEGAGRPVVVAEGGLCAAAAPAGLPLTVAWERLLVAVAAKGLDAVVSGLQEDLVPLECDVVSHNCDLDVRAR